MSVGEANQSLSFRGAGGTPIYLDSFHGKEGMSRLFSYELVLYAKADRFKPQELLNTPVSFSVTHGNDPKQWYNGICQQFQYGSRLESGFFEYRITVVPDLWKLTKTQRYRIFNNELNSDIISSVLSEHGIPVKVPETKQISVQCTQYGESDFHFISRLMEQEGLVYYFQHSEGSHQMIIKKGEDWAAKTTITPDSSQIYSVKPQYELRSNKTVIEEYDYSGGAKLLKSESNAKDRFVNKTQSGTITEYAGTSNTPHGTLKKYTDTRRGVDEAQCAKASFITFASKIRMGSAIECKEFPGFESHEKQTLIDPKWIPMELETHAFEENRIYNIEFDDSIQEDTELFIQEMDSDAQELDRVYGDLELDMPFILKADNYLNLCNSNPRGTTSFFNRIRCLRDKANLTPARVTTKPVIAGVQTARVVDHKLNDNGRIRVRFFWAPDKEEVSCFARLAQPIAGKGWGFMAMPREGQDVLVAFEQGDPDQPVIIGGVYNGKNHPAYPREEDWSKTYFRDEKGNEILFDEEGPDKYQSNGFGENDTTGPKGAYLTLRAFEHHSREVQKDMRSWIGGIKKETVDKDSELTVKGSRTTKITKDDTLEITGNHTTKVTQNEKLEAMEVKITAKTTIKLEAGGSSIELGPQGVTINGSMIKINGSGMVDIKGGVIKLN